MKKGISLIVLIITIIIMIILASAIILTINNTNIMDRAEDAVNASNEVEMKQIAVVAWQEAYLAGVRSESQLTTRVKEHLLNSGFTQQQLDKYEITATENGVKVTKIETLGSLVASAADYGKTVNYAANGVNNWKVFYKQTVAGEEYVYLIASECLTSTQIPAKVTDTVANGGAGATINGNNIYWSSEPTAAATIVNPDLWLVNIDESNISYGFRCSSYLAYEPIWTDFKNTQTYGDNVVGAIGSPTSEMFVESWNQKGQIYNTQDKIKYEQLELTEDDFINGSSSTTISTGDKLYVLETASYWLAASQLFNGRIMSIRSLGRINDTEPNEEFGLRPVVCFKASTPAAIGTITDIELK